MTGRAEQQEACCSALPCRNSLGNSVERREERALVFRGEGREAQCVGVPLVLAIYTASAFYRVWPNPLTLWLSQNRRSLGLSFALTHTVHLVAILNYIGQPGSPPQPPVGILGYAFIYLMAFSANPRSMKTLGVWWKRAHGVGVQVIFLYYLNAYGEILFEPELRPIGIVVVPLLLAALGIRLAGWLKGRSANADSPADPASHR